MNNKKLALIIQIVLFISIFIIGFLTYNSIEKDGVVNSKYPPFKKTAGDCPIIQKRPCVEESYTQTPIDCPPQPEECNGQDGIKTCYKLEWKQKIRVGYCRMCGGIDIDHYNNRSLVKCKQ